MDRYGEDHRTGFGIGDEDSYSYIGGNRPLTAEQQAYLEAKDIDWKARQALIEKWNAVGQYFKIGDFLYPRNLYRLLDAYDNFGEHVLITQQSDAAFFRVSLSFERTLPTYQLGRTVGIDFYRAASASDDDPWLMYKEFVASANLKKRPLEAVRIEPWW